MPRASSQRLPAKISRRPHLLRLHGFLTLTLLIALVHLVVLSSVHLPILQNILGYQSDITVDQVYTAVNTLREREGAQPLQLNLQLSQAAYAKAQDMLQKGYWAHSSPDGKEPWDFISDQGYSYHIAGENLARNFSHTQELLEAWQASPTHNANIVSSAYSQTGIAVLQGEMNGIPTTLVVQLFASPEEVLAEERETRASSEPETASLATTPIPEPAEAPQAAVLISPQQEALLGSQTLWREPQNETTRPVISPLDFYRGSAIVLLVVMLVLVARDFRREKRHRQLPKGSKHLAHLVLLVGVLITLVLAESGNLL